MSGVAPNSANAASWCVAMAMATTMAAHINIAVMPSFCLRFTASHSNPPIAPLPMVRSRPSPS